MHLYAFSCEPGLEIKTPQEPKSETYTQLMVV